VTWWAITFVVGVFFGALGWDLGYQRGKKKGSEITYGDQVWYDEVDRARKTLADAIGPWAHGGYTIDTLARWVVAKLNTAPEDRRR
jgi:hypothetical protein